LSWSSRRLSLLLHDDCSKPCASHVLALTPWYLDVLPTNLSRTCSAWHCTVMQSAPQLGTHHYSVDGLFAITLLDAAQYERPPYRISNGNTELRLGVNTIGMTARHADGALEYDAHNLYGLAESAATASAVASVTSKRPFILSRCAHPRSRRLSAGCQTSVCPMSYHTWEQQTPPHGRMGTLL